jgi:hypothetical protein
MFPSLKRGLYGGVDVKKTTFDYHKLVYGINEVLSKLEGQNTL